MPKLMTDAAVAQYHQDGYYFPLQVLNDEQVAACRTQLEEFESTQGEPIFGGAKKQIPLAV